MSNNCYNENNTTKDKNQALGLIWKTLVWRIRVQNQCLFVAWFDFLKGDKTIYHVEKVLRETGQVIDDGLHEIFVNTAVDDGTVIV